MAEECCIPFVYDYFYSHGTNIIGMPRFGECLVDVLAKSTYVNSMSGKRMLSIHALVDFSSQLVNIYTTLYNMHNAQTHASTFKLKKFDSIPSYR